MGAGDWNKPHQAGKESRLRTGSDPKAFREGHEAINWKRKDENKDKTVPDQPA